MDEYNKRKSILSDILGTDYINRNISMQAPVMWWENDKTKLNADNLNKLSRGINDVQTRLKLESYGTQSLLEYIVKESAGWLSTENSSGTAEIFNDYKNNRAFGDYSHAEGFKTTAGHIDGYGQVSGNYSHTQGIGTVAACDFQHVIGRWNLPDIVPDSTKSGSTIPGNTYAFIIGGGTLKEGKDNWQLEENINRKNIHTVDWNGNGWFANNISADGNLSVGTPEGGNKHEFNGNVCFQNSIRAHSNLRIDGNVKLGAEDTITNLVVNSNSNFKGEFNSNAKATFNKTVVLNGTLSADEESNFNNNVNFKSGYSVNVNSKLNVNGLTEFKGDINGGINIINGDVKILLEDERLVSTVALHNCLDYASLEVAENDTVTVQNAINCSVNKLIGETELTLDNLGEIEVPQLNSKTIYGVAQYSINLVKSLLNAYILDNDSDDPEARSAIDKLIEVADWIKDDDSGAGKIISDLKSLLDKQNTWDEAYDNMHSHDNITELNSITSGLITQWNSAYSEKHSHSNFELLSKITPEDIANWNNAVLLDGVTQEAIQGVIDDGAQIKQNQKDIEEINGTLDGINNSISDLDQIRLDIAKLRNDLDSLITYGTDDPTTDTNTKYYIKYDPNSTVEV